MDSNVAAVMRGFMALSADQKTEFLTLINSYNAGDSLTRDRISKRSRDFGNRGVTRVDLGPTSAGCPCCGR